MYLVLFLKPGATAAVVAASAMVAHVGGDRARARGGGRRGGARRTPAMSPKREDRCVVDKGEVCGRGGRVLCEGEVEGVQASAIKRARA